MSNFSTPPAATAVGAVTSASILDATIVNADVNASAAIALSKLAAVTASKALASDSSGFVAATSVTSTELGYVSGVTSAIQTQITAKAPSTSPTFSGTITTPLTASRAVVLGASSELAVSAVTATELGYVSGVTSAIQTQMNLKAPLASPTFSGTITTALTANRALTTGASGVLAAATTTDTEIGYVSGVTSAIQTQINGKLSTATGTMTGILAISAATSNALLQINNTTASKSWSVSTDASGIFTITADAVVAGVIVAEHASSAADSIHVKAGKVGIFNSSPNRTLEVGASADTTNVNLRLNGLSTTGANVGTLTNCPHTGNPTLYIEVDVKGTTYCIPCFALS